MEIPRSLQTAVTAGSMETKPVVTAVTAVKGSRWLEADLLFDDLADLVEERLKPWYCKQFNRLGRERVLRFASQARADGFDKRRLFSYLLVHGR